MQWSAQARAGFVTLFVAIVLTIEDWQRASQSDNWGNGEIYWVIVATFALLCWLTYCALKEPALGFEDPEAFDLDPLPVAAL